MLIAVISVLHVLVSHYAVGGGFFLAVETRHAYRTGNSDYLAYLRKHARFFILLTIVYGAITGLGIWWTIGLASPLATAVLIRTFVFGWAIEYVSFVLELVSAMIFYYYWGRLPQKTHMTMAWIYAWAAWASLVIITAITGFMLHPGGWLESRGFWDGLLNPQFLPQVIARTGGALVLTTLYVYLHASLSIRKGPLHDLIESRSARPALLGAVLISVGGVLWYLNLPPSAKDVLATMAALNIFMALIFALTIAVFVFLYLGPYRNPGWLTPGFAMAMFLFGVAAVSTGEFVREAVRKPYIIYNVVFGNQVLTDEVDDLRRQGYLEGGTWTRAFVAHRYPQIMDGDRIDESRLVGLRQHDRITLGQLLFQYHCNDCHAAELGYSAAGRLLQGRSAERVYDLVLHLDEEHYFMPPWCGTPEEARLLTDYLMTIAPKRPEWMLPRDAEQPEGAN
jgi:cytochrome bd-type quinol oxidase subunit 1